MSVRLSGEAESQAILKKTKEFYEEYQLANYKRTDRLFSFLMPLQWLGGIIAALLISPFTWSGAESSIHIHVMTATILGGVISLLPSLLGYYLPGNAYTRQIIAVGQMLTSALLVHLSGGRIETHFHIFGSLALLAFYRDIKIFPIAITVTALDHFVRGYYFPQTVFGVAYASPWRAVEHSAWVIFEVSFLIWSCRASNKDVWAVAKHRALEMQQRQAQKLESIGQLAAGIAHEINTPIQFVGDNVRFLQEEFKSINPFLKLCSTEDIKSEDTLSKINETAKNLDTEYLSDEIPKAIEQSLEGISRITKIVRAMKEFSHPGQSDKQTIDLNHAIESTILVSTNEWKYVAELKTSFDASLPFVPCIVGEINQVILNLIVNAAHAIADVKDQLAGNKGTITVSTKNLGDKVEIRIKDTGVGIASDIADKVYDPFFTTKGVGKGTGQGLAIARNIIINKHGGSIHFDSKVGKGTEFILTLPFKEAVLNHDHNDTQAYIQ